jgi:hypothetical protein
MKNIVAFHWALESHGKTSGMNQYKAYQLIPKENRIFKNIDQMFFIHAHFAVKNLDDVMQIINKNAMRCVAPGTTLALDEATYAYQPSHAAMKKAEKLKDPMTKLHIPRNHIPIVFYQILLQQT